MITVPTILLAFSLLGILSMLGIKSYELRTGKNSLLARLSDRWDHKLASWTDTIHIWFANLNRDTLINFIITCIQFLIQITRNIFERIVSKAKEHPQSKKVFDMVSGKTPVRRGGASVYLKKIGEDRLMK